MRIQAQIVAFISCIFISLNLHAQDPNHRFGKIDEDHVTMTSYEPDPEAGAVILYSRGDRYYELVNDKLRLVYVFHKRIKILAESAQDLADVEVPYYSYGKYESMADIKGVTYNVDVAGKIESQKLSKDAIFQEEVNEFWSETKFSLPNVKVGSVIEYQYTIYSNDFANMRTWYFQDVYPTIYSETNLGRPEGFNYAPTMMGEYYPVEKTLETYRSVNLRDGDRDVYIARNIPAFVHVPYLRAAKNHLLRLELKLVNINVPGRFIQEFNQSWEKINQDLVENSPFKVVAKPDRQGKILAGLVIEGETDPIEISERLYKHIRTNYKWNRRFSMYPYPKLSNLEEEGEGNGTSLNLLLVSALRAAGVEAYPVLVSTRANGMAQNVFPTLKQFNHSIVRVALPEGKQILMDLAANNTPLGMLPIHDLNDLGMQIGENGPEWVNLTPKRKADHATRGVITIDAERGTLEGNLACTDKGYAALASRSAFHDDEIEEDEEKYVNTQMMAGFGEFELTEYTLENTKEIEKAFEASCNFSTDEFVQVAGDRIYLQPLLHLKEAENPFKQEERKYMIDFTTPSRKKAILSYKLPEGWVAEEVPEPLKIAIPERGALFTYQVMNMGGQLQILSDLKINQAVFQPEMYLYLREFMDQVVAKQAEQIVLKKE